MPPPEPAAVESHDAAEDSKLIAGDTASPGAVAVHRPARTTRDCFVAGFYCCLYLVIGPTLIVVNRHILKELHFDYPMCLSGLGAAPCQKSPSKDRGCPPV